jgi:hypothetical protein
VTLQLYRMSLRPGLLWLTVDLALFIFSVYNNTLFLSIIHTP